MDGFECCTIICAAFNKITPVKLTLTHAFPCIETDARTYTYINIHNAHNLWDYTTQRSTNPIWHKYFWPTGRFHSLQKLHRRGKRYNTQTLDVPLSFSSQVTHTVNSTHVFPAVMSQNHTCISSHNRRCTHTYKDKDTQAVYCADLCLYAGWHTRFDASGADRIPLLEKRRISMATAFAVCWW